MSKDYHQLGDTVSETRSAPEIPQPSGIPTSEVGAQANAKRRRETRAGRIAREQYETAARLAPSFGQADDGTPWDRLPTGMRYMLVAVVEDLINRQVIR